MISNCAVDQFQFIEVTNELPFNRLGGVGSVIDSLIEGFATLGVPVLWYLTDHDYSADDIDRILAQFPNVAIGGMEELDKLKAPIAHLHTYNHHPRILDCLKNKKSVFTIHSLLRREAESNGIDLSIQIARQERLIAACDAVVLVSEAELQHYEQLGYRALNQNVHVIHNGLKCPSRSRWNAASKQLGFCGRLVPRKRPEYVQWILREQGFEEYRSLIAGRGFSTYARDLVCDPALQSRVRYLGWCGGARLDAFYDAIELLVIPSSYEPFGMVALEAMARGIPIVCTRIDGLVEVLGDHAIYAQDHSYREFHEAMQQWRHTSPAVLVSMVRAGQRRYVERFTDVIMADNYRTLFERLI
jgi:glycosyltransferase involved in cell wall biosynthesis